MEGAFRAGGLKALNSFLFLPAPAGPPDKTPAAAPSAALVTPGGGSPSDWMTPSKETMNLWSDGVQKQTSEWNDDGALLLSALL